MSETASDENEQLLGEKFYLGNDSKDRNKGRQREKEGKTRGLLIEAIIHLRPDNLRPGQQCNAMQRNTMLFKYCICLVLSAFDMMFI